MGKKNGSRAIASDVELIVAMNQEVFGWRPAWLDPPKRYAQATEAVAGSAKSAAIIRKTVLIVDDDILVVPALFRLLYRDFNIIAANSGHHALEILASVSSVSALMTDLRMPNMDGLQVLTAAKEFYPSMPRILFTGDPNRELIGAALRIGVLGVLYKPLDAAEVGQFLQLAVSDHWDAV